MFILKLKLRVKRRREVKKTRKTRKIREIRRRTRNLKRRRISARWRETLATPPSTTHI